MSRQNDNTDNTGHEEEWPELLEEAEEGEVEELDPAVVAAGGTRGSETVETGRFDREAVARRLAAAREKGTEADHQAEIIARILGHELLDPQTHFDSMGLIIILLLKVGEMPLAARQALASDPEVARAVYPHLRLAFPEQVAWAFDFYIGGVVREAPELLEAIQREAEEEGGAGR